MTPPPKESIWRNCLQEVSIPVNVKVMSGDF